MSRTVHCVKLDQEAQGLAAPPVPGDLGQRIFENVSQTAWLQWLSHQTMLINEYRLVLAQAKAREFLMTEMEKYFFGGGEMAQTGYVPPAENGSDDGTDKQDAQSG